jgi:hypothetical protein
LISSLTEQLFAVSLANRPNPGSVLSILVLSILVFFVSSTGLKSFVGRYLTRGTRVSTKDLSFAEPFTTGENFFLDYWLYTILIEDKDATFKRVTFEDKTQTVNDAPDDDELRKMQPVPIFLYMHDDKAIKINPPLEYRDVRVNYSTDRLMKDQEECLERYYSLLLAWFYSWLYTGNISIVQNAEQNDLTLKFNHNTGISQAAELRFFNQLMLLAGDKAITFAEFAAFCNKNSKPIWLAFDNLIAEIISIAEVEGYVEIKNAVVNNTQNTNLKRQSIVYTAKGEQRVRSLLAFRRYMENYLQNNKSSLWGDLLKYATFFGGFSYNLELFSENYPGDESAKEKLIWEYEQMKYLVRIMQNYILAERAVTFAGNAGEGIMQFGSKAK